MAWVINKWLICGIYKKLLFEKFSLKKVKLK